MTNKQEYFIEPNKFGYASVAFKIWVPILWAVVIGIFAANLIMNWNIDDEVIKRLSNQADQVAYTVSKINNLYQDVPLELDKSVIELTLFVSLEAYNGTQLLLKVGQNNDNLSQITRSLHLPNINNSRELFSIRLYHPPMSYLVKQKRKRQMLLLGIPLVILGFVLASLVHFIVTLPIRELVRATQDVSKGNLEAQIKTNRQDEFGLLADFFNKMLRQLKNKQLKLSQSVDSLEAADKTKNAFLANMSHEIRTPLTSIIGFSESLLDTDMAVSDKVDAINTVIASGKHLLQIINDILDVSKIQANMMDIETIPVNIFQLLEDVYSIANLQAQPKGLNFSINYEYPLPIIIMSDPIRLKQILLNLTSNAIKFTKTGRVKICVNYAQEKHQLKLNVIDSGIGIDAETQSSLFQAFCQGDISTTRNYGGTGLGLSLSKSLVHKLGGDITVSSKKGLGSIFTVNLNISTFDELRLVDKLPEKININSLNKRILEDSKLSGHVLLVDDNVDNQKLISLYLQKMGLAVTVANNGLEAVEKALSNEYGVILMDVQMPVMGGLEATQLLRSNQYAGAIVALTANAMQSDINQCHEAGCDDFLSKPIDRAKFASTIRRLIGVRSEKNVLETTNT